MIPREMFGLFQCFPKGKLSFVRNLFAFDRIHVAEILRHYFLTIY